MIFWIFVFFHLIITDETPHPDPYLSVLYIRGLMNEILCIYIHDTVKLLFSDFYMLIPVIFSIGKTQEPQSVFCEDRLNIDLIYSVNRCK